MPISGPVLLLRGRTFCPRQLGEAGTLPGALGHNLRFTCIQEALSHPHATISCFLSSFKATLVLMFYNSFIEI